MSSVLPADSKRTPAAAVAGIKALLVAVLGGGGAAAIGPPTEMPKLLVGFAIAVGAAAWCLANYRAFYWQSRLLDGTATRGRYIVRMLIGMFFGTVCYVVIRLLGTAEYSGSPLVIGFNVTENGRSLVEQQHYTNEQMLMAAAGDPHACWTSPSIVLVHAGLWLSYGGMVLSFLYPILLFFETYAPLKPPSQGKRP